MNVKSLITSTVISQNDWSVESKVDALPSDCIFFYIVDFSLGLTRLLGIKKTDFEQIALAAKNQLDFNISDAVGCIGFLVKNNRKKIMTESDLSALITSVCAYFSNTKTFEAMNEYIQRFQVTPHVLINVYRKGSSDHVTIRPSVFGSDSLIAEPSEVIGTAREVFRLDAISRPNDVVAVIDRL